jgi:2-C-methyl-D-erythritol 2,4-cyclodiphosphate synthase|tara:strand:- start:767 stop:1246 length:480 start_codon:yes stop_codon:yes gene_type:complete
MTRIGVGYDVHRLDDGEDLYIGGVKIPSDVGSVGHSDGDALCHAIVDALLGAVGLGDIGKYFPSSDDSWKDVQSSVFLIDALSKINNAGFNINNIDTTIIIQKPRLENHVLQIRENLSKIIDLDESKINVKATTTDGLGTIGDGQGWAVLAVVSLIKIS